MNDVMLDFETLGTGENKCVCQVAAIYFNNSTGELGKSFKMNVDAQSHTKYGAKIDANTVYWWLKQSDQARSSILNDLQDVHSVFTELNEFLSEAKRIWSHSTFDFVTLVETMRQLGIKPKFTYKAGLDIRTLVYLAGTRTDSVAREGVHHDALDDCKHQIKYCVLALKEIKTYKKLVQLLERTKD